MQPLLALYDIEKRFDERIVLKFGYLALEAGRIYLLSGPNGSGKSTLLNLMGFLDSPDRGEVALDGKESGWIPFRAHQARQQVTLVHQNPYMIKGTVFDNVAYGLKLREVTARDIKRKVADALEMVHLEGFAGRNARQLSGGEIRRVAIARALACSPRLLLLDEPMANLDAQSAELIEKTLAALPSLGTTVVLSSHDPEQALRLNASIIRLEAGALVKPVVPRPELSGFEWENQGLQPAFSSEG